MKIISSKNLFRLTLAALTLFLPAYSFAQQAGSSETVPTVKCRNFAGNGGSPDGELPHIENKGKEVSVSPHEEKLLAFYQSPVMGVLAPRGWSCIGKSGASGADLTVTPQPIKMGDSFINGPAVIVEMDDGSTSGRFEIADVIGRYFPKHKNKFYDDVVNEGLMPVSDFATGPYPYDKLNYISDSIVQIETPAGKEGFGTEVFVKNGSRIKGAVRVDGLDGEAEAPFAISLYVRLQNDKDNLAPEIIRQFVSGQ